MKLPAVARRHGGTEDADLRRDGMLLTATRGLRGFVDGITSVVLSAYLTLLGYSGTKIGVLVTAMLLGSAGLTLLAGTYGHRFARRSILLAGALLMIATGITFASTTVFAVLLVVGTIGTVNPTSGDISVFLPMEQSLLPATTTDERRTAVFARYAFIGGIFGAIGSLAASVPDFVADHTSISRESALRGVFAVYALAGAAAFFIYRALSPAIEPASHQRPAPLGESKRVVYRLAAVFSLDAFGGGFTVQSLLALWLYKRFDLSVTAAGALLFWTGTCSALSVFLAVRIAKRIGLVRTMVFTHLPAQVLLISAALMPNLPLAVACLVARSLLSTMDAPVRNSYVMAVVSPAERAAAASLTNVPRSLAAALPPTLAGWMLAHSSFGWPLIIAGVLKAIYDLTLLSMFRHVRPPEEQAATG